MTVAVGALEEIISEGLRLGAHFARPPGLARVPGLLILPGFPRGPGGAAAVGNTYASLVDRIAREAGWAALTFTMRGTGTSEGDFSIEGWLADVRAAIDALHARTDVTGVWFAGLPARRHARDRRRRPRRPRARARDVLRARVAAHVGATTRRGSSSTRAAPACCATPTTRPIPARWIRAIANLDSSTRPAYIAPRPWLLVHGSDDDVVPVDDARLLHEAGGRLRRAAHRRRTGRTACATTRARSPRSSAGSTARRRSPARRDVSRGARPAGRRASVSSSVYSGFQPVAACSLEASPTRRGISTGRTSAGSWTRRSGRCDCASRSSAISRDRDAGAGADVVDLARRAVLGEQPVRAHDVADVVDVAHRVERCRRRSRRVRRARPRRCAARARGRGSSATGPGPCG